MSAPDAAETPPDERDTPRDAPIDAPIETIDAEAHRAIAREMHMSYQRVYSVGGLVVMALAAAMTVTLALIMGPLKLLPWVAGVTTFLSGLLGLRTLVRQQRARLLGRAVAYAEVNHLPLDAWRDFWAARDEYPYFVALLDDRAPARPGGGP